MHIYVYVCIMKWVPKCINRYFEYINRLQRIHKTTRYVLWCNEYVTDKYNITCINVCITEVNAWIWNSMQSVLWHWHGKWRVFSLRLLCMRYACVCMLLKVMNLCMHTYIHAEQYTYQCEANYIHSCYAYVHKTHIEQHMCLHVYVHASIYACIYYVLYAWL